MQARTISVALTALFAGACATTAPSDPEALMLPSIESCTGLAVARCERMDTCSGGVLTARLFGSLGACERRVADACALHALAPGVDAAPARIDACMAALTEATCADLRAGDPVACLPGPGLLGTGAACAFAEQCASEVCVRAPGASCGTCALPCDASTCPAPGVCIFGRCAIPIDDAPSAIVPVRPIPGLVSEPVPALDGFHASPSDRCEGACGTVVARDGEPCDAPGVVCAESGRCVDGACVSASPDGGLCWADPRRGPGCMMPARCVRAPGASLGICQRPVPATCALVP